MKISDYLPRNLRHLEHSKLCVSLQESLSHFADNQIVDEAFVRKFVEVFASEFDAAFDRAPINSKVLQLSEDSAIVNYRFDRGYWSIVVPGTTVMVTDQTKTALFKDKVNLAIEGSGGGLRKGKRKSESIKRAYSRQIAKDVRWNESSNSDESESELDDDSSDWEG
jgi:hypothetical protein